MTRIFIVTANVLLVLLVQVPVVILGHAARQVDSDESTTTLSSSLTDIDKRNRRQLQIGFGRSVVCSPTNTATKNFYETITIRNSRRSYYFRTRGAVPGSCIDSCEALCNHKPCYDDYKIVQGDDCQCFRSAPSNCGPNSLCNTTSETCTCNAGYAGRPQSINGCTDIDECSSPTSNQCGKNTLCTNTQGSYTCSCKVGYTGTQPLGVGCSDLDECQSSICGPNGNCTNLEGNYACACRSGYTWTGSYSTGCVNVDECKTKPGSCPANSLCTDTVGSFECKCRDGFRGTPPATNCTDIDECAEKPGICGSNTVCTNTIGNYTCACARGFDGTPPNCIPDSCTRGGVICGNNALCNATTSQCACQPGYESPNVRSGGNCTDVNECTVLSRPCTSTAPICSNIPGSFRCLIETWNECPTKANDACGTGVCAQLSRSDPTYVCCEVAESCTGGSCCNGAYGAGEACVNTKDCSGTLKCGRVDRFATRSICCARTYSPIGSTLLICR